MTPREAEIQSLIVEYLEAHRFVVIRVNSGLVKRGKHFIKLAKKGTADIVAILPPTGRVLAVECKKPGEEPRKDQLAFLESVRRVGGIGIVATGVDDVARVIQ